MGESREVRSTRRGVGERGERLPVQRHSPVRGQRLLDREAGEFVAERDALPLSAEHTGARTLFETIDAIVGEGFHEPQLGLLRDDRNSLEERSGARPQMRGPRENRVSDRRRDLAFPGRQSLGDEERVPGGLSKELVSVDAVRLGQRRHCGRRQWLDLQALDRLARRKLAEHGAQRMDAIELIVPVRGDDKGGNRHDSARQQP